LELPSPARAKFGSSPFTPASAVFDPFGQIVTAIIRSKTELWIFGQYFIITKQNERRDAKNAKVGPQEEKTTC